MPHPPPLGSAAAAEPSGLGLELQTFLLAMEKRAARHHDELLDAIEGSRQAIEERLRELPQYQATPTERELASKQESVPPPSTWPSATGLTPQTTLSKALVAPAAKKVLSCDGKEPATAPSRSPALSAMSPATSALTKAPKSRQISNLSINVSDKHQNPCMHGPFDFVIGCMIVVASSISFLQLEVLGRKAAKQMGLPEGGEWPDLEIFFSVSEHFFNFLFMAELTFRLAISRFGYLREPVNLIDAFFVVATIIDTYVLGPLNVGSGKSLVFGRMLRFARVVRTLRIVRVMKMFVQLRLLVKTIASSMMALVWSMAVLGILQLMGAMFMCQMLQDFVADETQDLEVRLRVYEMYGTSIRALWTFFEATFSGCWPSYAQYVVDEVSYTYVLFFVVYVCMVVFAVTRIISALFLQETMKTAAEDADMMIRLRAKERDGYMMKLKELFLETDTSKDGYLSFEEFEAVFENPKVKIWCSTLGIEVHEVRDLFDLLDDGDGLVTYNEFVNGIMLIKGQARSQDVIAILHETHKILQHCVSMNAILQPLRVQDETQAFSPAT